MSLFKKLLLPLLYFSSLLLCADTLQDQSTLLYYAVQYKDAQGNVLPNLTINSSNVSLVITATNQNPQTPVNVASISFTIPEGTDGSDLTAAILTSNNVIAPPNWSYYWNGNKCIFTPNTPADGQITANSVYFIFNQINVNNTVGSVPIEIDEQSSKLLSATLQIDKFPESFQFSDLSANPSTVGFGGSTTISWTGSSDATYTIQYGNLPSPIPVTGSGSYIYQAVNLQQNPTTFTVTASMANPDDPSYPLIAQKQVTVTVNVSPGLSTSTILTFMGSPVTLSWQVPNADPGTTGLIIDETNNLFYTIPASQLENGNTIIETPIQRSSVTYSLVYKQGGQYKNYSASPIQLVTTMTFNVGINPKAIAISPDGRYAYVPCSGADENSPNISVYSFKDSVMLQPIQLSSVFRFLRDIAITPNGKFAYAVAIWGFAAIIDTSSNTCVGQPILVGNQPVAIAITPDGKFAYIAQRQRFISIINISSNTSLDLNFNFYDFPEAIVITPDGKFVYLCGINNTHVIDTYSNKVINTVPVGIGTKWGKSTIAFTPDRKSLYVPNNNDHNVSIINTSSNTVVGQPILVGNQPVAIAISLDGKFAYVVNNGDKNVSIINTSSNTVVGQPIPVGSQPVDIAITPDGKFALVVNNGDSTISIISLAYFTPPTEKP